MANLLLIASYGALPYMSGIDIIRKRQFLPNQACPGSVKNFSLNEDGSILAVSINTSPHVVFYNTSNFNLVTKALDIPTNVSACHFSPDGSLFVVTSTTAPFITIYNTSDWSKLPTPSVTMGGLQEGSCFSPDGAFFVVGSSSAPYVLIYDTSTWTPITVGSLPTSRCYACVFNNSGSLLVVLSQYGSVVNIYNTSDWSKLADLAVKPVGTTNSVAFNPDDSLMSVAQLGSPGLSIYETTLWGKIAGPSKIPPGGQGRRVAFNQDGSLLALGTSARPYGIIYNTADWSENSMFLDMTYGTTDALMFFSPKIVKISGEVRDMDGYVASRTVRVYERSSGDLVGSAISSPVDGTYDVSLYEGDVEYDVQFMADPLENLNDLFFARATAAPE